MLAIVGTVSHAFVHPLLKISGCKLAIDPRAGDAILGHSRGRRAMHAHQVASGQKPHPILDRAFRQPGCIGDRPMTQASAFPAPADGLAPQMQVDEKGRRGAIMTDQIPHQDLENVVVYNYSIDHYSKKNRIARRREVLYSTGMIKSVKFVSIPVRDQNQALEFYTKKLGFQIMTDQPFGGGRRWIELRIPGADTEVVLFTPRARKTGSDLSPVSHSLPTVWRRPSTS
jgi:Glyoxalase/Bleomycin resistance protein/Dioxygenase superfamily